MERGFFGSLFDFSFSSFITIRLIKVIYALFIAASAFFALLFVTGAFRASALFGLFVLLIGAPVLFLFYVILARVYLELVVAIFRIAENTSILAGQGRSLSGPPPGSSASPAPPPSPPPAPSSAVDPLPPAIPLPPPDQEPPSWAADGEPPPFPPAPPDAEPPPTPSAPRPPADTEPRADEPTEAVPPAPTRPRRQAPLRPRRTTSEPPPEPPT